MQSMIFRASPNLILVVKPRQRNYLVELIRVYTDGVEAKPMYLFPDSQVVAGIAIARVRAGEAGVEYGAPSLGAGVKLEFKSNEGELVVTRIGGNGVRYSTVTFRGDEIDVLATALAAASAPPARPPRRPGPGIANAHYLPRKPLPRIAGQ